MTVDVTALAISVTSTGIKETSQSLGGLSTSAGNAEKRIIALTEAMKKMQGVTTILAQTSGNTSALTAALTALNNSLVLLAQRTQQADTTQRRHNEGMREAHGLARGLAGSLGALWVTYGNLAGMAVGVGIGAALKAVVVQGKDVEHTLEGIRVRGQETVGAINEMRESLLKLGQGVYGPQQVANAFETLILAGLNAEQALVSISAALNLATVGGTTIEKSAQTLVSVGTAIGYTAEGFSRVGDVISKTAALSMSSVETLSEAFKSASSVSKLYGVSLEDIATELGALSNLGIQGSAAGTALKNMYKELASEADKVQSTFKKMGMNSMSLKDAEGNFRPLLTVVGELDSALKKLTPAEEKLAIARLSNERGMRMLVQVLDLYRTKLAEGGNSLEKFNKDVTDSYGFMAMGAVQMAQTAKSQIDSMMNTLKTVFVKTFKGVEPEIILFTQNMKRAFSSKEFQQGILTIANAFASMALAIAENIPLITKMVTVLVAIKAAIAIGAIIQATTTAMVALSVAMKAAAAGALTMTVAMPALIPLLVLAAAAWAAYKLASSEAVAEKSAAVAAAYSKSVIDGMIAEAEQLRKTTDLIKKKMDAGAAAKKVEQDSMLQLMATKDQAALADARAETERARMSNNLGRYREGLAAVARLELQAANNAKIAAAAQAALAKEAKENAEAVAAQAKLKAPRPEGNTTLGGDPDKAKINDVYAASMIAQMAVIKSAKREMAAFEDQQNTLFKMGEIGKLQFLEQVQQKEIELFIKAQEARREQLRIAQTKGSQADVARVSGDMEQAREDLDNKNVQSRLNKEATVQKAVEEYTKLRITQLEQEHSYAKAAQLRWSSDHSAAFEAAKRDAELYGDIYPVLKDRVEQLAATQKAAMKVAFNREDVREFNTSVDATRNAMKGIQTASEGNGLAAMFEAAKAASDRYASDLPALREKMSKLTDPKAIEEAQAQLTNLAETQRKLWEGVGESISDSLESAFGRGGKAAADLVRVAVNYSNLEKKDGNARIKAYGDAAGAAKGFFKEGTTGYKVMEGAEKAFRAIELAGMAKSLATTIANSAAKAIAYIPEFLMAWGSLGPWGLAAGAVAIAAILGGSGGSGVKPMSAEDRQANAGKGSVLGDKDAKSESIANSLEILEKNSGLGLVHSSSMVKSLQTLVSGISNLSSLVLRTAGLKDGVVEGVTEGHVSNGLAKVFGSGVSPGIDKLIGKLFGTRTNVLDQGIKINSSSLGGIETGGVSANSYADVETKKKFFGVTTSTKYDTKMQELPKEINDQFTLAIMGLAETVSMAANSLGMGGDAFTAKLKTFVVDISEISIKGLTGKEIQEQFESIFSKLGDDMAKFAVEGLDSKIGEGYFETLARVANELIQVKDVFAVVGQQFNLTGMEAVKISGSLVLAAGSLEKLTEGTKFFVDNFLTEAERMAPITDSVTKRLAELGVSELTTVEMYKNKVKALDLTNAADQKLYTNLLELAPAFKESAEYAENLATGTVNLTKAQQLAKSIADKQRELDIRLMEAQGNSIGAIAARRQDELAALAKLNPTLAQTQQAIYDVEDAFSKNTAKRAIELRIMEAQGNTVGVLARKREDEVNALKRTNPELVGLLQTLYATEDAAKAAAAAQAKLEKITSSSASLDIRMAQAQGNSGEVLRLQRKAELTAMNEVSPALGKYLKQIYDVEDANESNTKASETLTKAKDTLKEAYDRESSSMGSVIDKFKSFSESLKKFKQELLGGALSTLSPEQKYLNSKNNFSSVAARAATGDEGAIGELQNVSQEFLEASRGYNASTELYAKDFNLVQAALDQGIYAVDMQISAAQAQLAVMNAQYTSLEEIKVGVLSFKDAMSAYLLADSLTKEKKEATNSDPDYVQWFKDNEKARERDAKEAEAKAEINKTMQDLLTEIATLNANTVAAINQQGAIAVEQATLLSDITYEVGVVGKKISALEIN